MIIGEFGNVFCDSVGIDRSMSSIPHKLVDKVVSKADIYAKLGITFSQLADTRIDSLPEITVLRNLELNFDFSESSSSIDRNNNFLRISNLFLDLLIINRETSSETVDGISIKSVDKNNYIRYAILSIPNTKFIDMNIINTLRNDCDNIEGNICTCHMNICSSIANMSISRTYTIDKNTDKKSIKEMEELFAECLTIRVKKCIGSLIKRTKNLMVN
jgi:hypothetical protein